MSDIISIRRDQEFIKIDLELLSYEEILKLEVEMLDSLDSIKLQLDNARAEESDTGITNTGWFRSTVRARTYITKGLRHVRYQLQLIKDEDLADDDLGTFFMEAARKSMTSTEYDLILQDATDAAREQGADLEEVG